MVGILWFALARIGAGKEKNETQNTPGWCQDSLVAVFDTNQNFRMAFSIGEEFYTACYQGDIPRARNGMRNGADINFTCR